MASPAAAVLVVSVEAPVAVVEVSVEVSVVDPVA
jgi:hypothetical protein